jgi:hypothetical protein
MFHMITVKIFTLIIDYIKIIVHYWIKDKTLNVSYDNCKDFYFNNWLYKDNSALLSVQNWLKQNLLIKKNLKIILRNEN